MSKIYSFLIFLLTIFSIQSCNKNDSKYNKVTSLPIQKFDKFEIVKSTVDKESLKKLLLLYTNDDWNIRLLNRKTINSVHFFSVENEQILFEIKKDLLFLNQLETVEDVKLNFSALTYYSDGPDVVLGSEAYHIYHIYDEKSNCAYKVCIGFLGEKVVYIALLHGTRKVKGKQRQRGP